MVVIILWDNFAEIKCTTLVNEVGTDIEKASNPWDHKIRQLAGDGLKNKLEEVKKAEIGMCIRTSSYNASFAEGIVHVCTPKLHENKKLTRTTEFLMKSAIRKGLLMLSADNAECISMPMFGCYGSGHHLELFGIILQTIMICIEDGYCSNVHTINIMCTNNSMKSALELTGGKKSITLSNANVKQLRQLMERTYHGMERNEQCRMPKSEIVSSYFVQKWADLLHKEKNEIQRNLKRMEKEWTEGVIRNKETETPTDRSTPSSKNRHGQFTTAKSRNTTTPSSTSYKTTHSNDSDLIKSLSCETIAVTDEMIKPSSYTKTPTTRAVTKKAIDSATSKTPIGTKRRKTKLRTLCRMTLLEDREEEKEERNDHDEKDEEMYISPKKARREYHTQLCLAGRKKKKNIAQLNSLLELFRNKLTNQNTYILEFLQTSEKGKKDFDHLKEYFSKLPGYKNTFNQQESTKFLESIKDKSIEVELNDVISKINEGIETVTMSAVKNSKLHSAIPVYKALVEEKNELSSEKATIDIMYNAIVIMDKLNHINSLLKANFIRVWTSLEKSIHKKVIRLPKNSDADYAVRQLGRVAFHVKSKKEDMTSDWKSIGELYPELHKEFLIDEETDIEQDISNLSLEEKEALTSSPEFEVHDTIELEEGGLYNPDEHNTSEQKQIQRLEVNETDNSVRVQNNEPDANNYVMVEEEIVNEVEGRQLPSKIENIVDDLVHEELHEELDDDVNDLQRAVLRKLTFVRRCNENCPRIVPKEALHLHNLLGPILKEKRNQHDFEKYGIVELFERVHDEFGQKSALAWITKFKPCYSGFRNIYNRMMELKRLVQLIANVDSALRTTDLDRIREILNFKNFPTRIVKSFTTMYSGGNYKKELTEMDALGKHKTLLVAFEEKLQINETSICDVCNLFTLPTDISNKTYDTIKNYLRSTIPQKNLYTVCRTCTRSIAIGKIPAAAEINNMGIDPIPKVLSDFNWIEESLIQMARPVQSIVHLKNIGGRRTGVKGTSGPMVVLPVPINETINHVAKTLPATDNLVLHVSTSIGDHKLVNVPKVIRALMFLKENHSSYRKIQINKHFKFTDTDNIVFDKSTDPTKRYNELTWKNHDDGHLLTQKDFTIQTVQEANPITRNNGLAYEQYALKGNPYLPTKVDTPHVDVMAFPKLHCSGRYGIDHERKVKIGRAKYIRSRLLNKDRRFGKCMKWKAYKYGIQIQREMMSTLGVQARVRRDMHGKEIEKLLNEDLKFSSTLSNVFRKIRGFAPYWNGVKMDLRAHQATFGPPTWFATFNPAEEDWTEIHRVYEKHYGKEVNADNIRQIIADDPTLWCKYFERRVKNFVKTILLAERGPLGKVRHFFHRVEYQHRGSQHIHAVFWCDDAPTPGSDAATITSYIDSHVTARLPSKELEPTLHNLVVKHQMHWKRHSKTCLRVVRFRGKIYSHCRFGFPRPAIAETRLNKLNSRLIGVPGANHKQYFLKRKRGQEQLVNDYSPSILLGWKGNVDLQYIVHDAADVFNYVAGYATKGEKSKAGTMYSDIEPTDEKGSRRLFRTMIDMMNKRIAGCMEIEDMLLSIPLYTFDAGHIFINTNAEEERDRILVPQRRLTTNARPYKDNMNDTYYPGRPKSLEKFSLINISINFHAVVVSRAKKQIVRENSDSEGSDMETKTDDIVFNEEVCDDILRCNPLIGSYHTENNRSFSYRHPSLDIGTSFTIDNSDKVLRKCRARVPRLFWRSVDENDTSACNNFFRTLCLLFIPWREENNMLKEMEVESFEQGWQVFLHNLRENNAEAADDIMKLIGNHSLLKEEDEEKAARRAERRKAIDDLKIEEEVEDELEVFNRKVDGNKHAIDENNLNTLQKELYDVIRKRISEQEVSRGKEPSTEDQLLLFVSGTAGTGKTFVINTIADELTLKYTDEKTRAIRPAVLHAAPTGLAAIAIRGSTIHSLFGIEVQHGANKEFKPLREQIKEAKRALFSNVKLIVIDEISMVSNIVLCKMNLRLQEIMGNTNPFGGMNILTFGDLLQLPPVMAPKVFEPIRSYQAREIFGDLAVGVSLWSGFDYFELTQNMRQKEDLEFGEIMGRIRVEAVTEEDVVLLKTRLIKSASGDVVATMEECAEYYIDIMKEDSRIMALFPTNDDVNEFNKAVIEAEGLQTFVVHAEESIVVKPEYQKNDLENKNLKKLKTERPYQEMKYSIEKQHERKSAKKKNAESSSRLAGGLEKTLTLAVGGRVMLRRNVDPGRGLVNGSTGTLKRIKIVMDDPEVLMILFDGHEHEYGIEKVSALYDFSFDEQRRRRQFPVCMAFAATIHKSQGMTIRNAVINLRGCFANGQHFVALSRVQNLKGVHLIDIDAKKIRCDIDSLKEYNRLRTKIGLPEHAIPVRTSSRTVPETNLEKEAKQFTKSINVKMAIGKVNIGKESKRQISGKKESEAMNREVTRMVKVRRAVLILGNIGRLRLKNVSGSDCFLIAAINIIHAMDEMKLYLTSNKELRREHMEFVEHLSSILDGTEKDVTHFRTMMPPTFHRGQCDAEEALEEILKRTPKEALKLCSFTRKTQLSCKCNTARETSLYVQHVYLERDNTVLDTLMNEIDEDASCNVCKGDNIKKKIELVSPAEQMYHIVAINRNGNENEQIDTTNNNIVAFENSWKIKACIEYIRHSHNTGHYVTWISNGEGLYNLVNDNKITGPHNIREGLKGMSVLLLEKVKREEWQEGTGTITTVTQPKDIDDCENDDCGDDEDEFHYLQLDDRGCDSFVIATLQILNNIVPLKAFVEDYKENADNGLVYQLKKIFRKQVNDVAAFRRDPLLIDQNDRSHALLPFMVHLFSVLPKEAKNACEFKYSINERCLCGARKVEDRRSIISLEVDNNASLEKKLTEYCVPLSELTICTICNTEPLREVRYSGSDEQQYMIVAIKRTNPDGCIQTVKKDGIQVNGQRWRLKACVEDTYRGDCQWEHYVTWIRLLEGGGYLVVDPDEPVRYSRTLNAKLKGYSVILFEVYEYERTKKGPKSFIRYRDDIKIELD